jgi:hypothetical protein
VDGTPSEFGAQAELAIAAALVASGRRVYLPFFGPDSRTDLVFEDKAGFHRVQCKTSRIVGGGAPGGTGPQLSGGRCALGPGLHRDPVGRPEL